MATTDISPSSPQIKTRYRTEQDDFSGISVIDNDDGKTVATIADLNFSHSPAAEELAQ